MVHCLKYLLRFEYSQCQCRGLIPQLVDEGGRCLDPRVVALMNGLTAFLCNSQYTLRGYRSVAVRLSFLSRILQSLPLLQASPILLFFCHILYSTEHLPDMAGHVISDFLSPESTEPFINYPNSIILLQQQEEDYARVLVIVRGDFVVLVFILCFKQERRRRHS